MASVMAQGDLATFACHKVDSARKAMQDPDKAAVATGRLFFAKRVHEAAMGRHADLDRILKRLLPLLNVKAKEGGPACTGTWPAAQPTAHCGPFNQVMPMWHRPCRT